MVGDSELHKAVLFGRLQKVAFLLENGADPNVLNDRRETPLFSIVADAVNEKLAEMLIAAGADLNVMNIHGDTVLHLAAAKNRESLIHMLLRSGASVDIQNQDGKIPKDVAISDKIRELLEEKAVEKKKRTAAGINALCFAVVGRNNNPLYFTSFKEERNLEFQYLIHMSLDVIEEKVSDRGRQGGDSYLGLLYVTDDCRIYGYISNTKRKFCLIVEDEDLREADMKAFFRRIHYYFTLASFNPFCFVHGKMVSPHFDRAVEVIRSRMFNYGG